MTVLVTGSKGMIGSKLVQGLLDTSYKVVGVDRIGDEVHTEQLVQLTVDLADTDALQKVVEDYHVDRIIHLAALAHTKRGDKVNWEDYKHINIDCAKNVFSVAGDRPVLFISTVDVFGFYDGKMPVTGTTPIQPVSKYGRSKALAEAECKKLPRYTIFRFSPVYSDEIKRDIQKRYYLKYPKIAYRIGKGSAFEILNIDLAVNSMIDWCGTEPTNDIRILKDEKQMWSPDYIKAEKTAGNAKVVIWIPKWAVFLGYYCCLVLMGKTERTYLINKLIFPLRTLNK